MLQSTPSHIWVLAACYVLLFAVLLVFQIKLGLDETAVALYLITASTFFFIVLWAAFSVFFEADMAATLSLGISTVLALIFIFIRQRKTKPSDAAAKAIYWIWSVFILQLSGFAAVVIFDPGFLKIWSLASLIFLFHIYVLYRIKKSSTKMSVSEFVALPEFSMYWIGLWGQVFLIAVFLNEDFSFISSDMLIFNLFLIIGIMSLGILVIKRRMGLAWSYESTFYSILFCAGVLFGITPSKSLLYIGNEDFGIILSFVISIVMLIVLFKFRKWSIHLLELVLLLIAFGFISFFGITESNLFSSSIKYGVLLTFWALVLIAAIAYRIKANAIVRAQVRI